MVKDNSKDYTDLLKKLTSLYTSLFNNSCYETSLNHAVYAFAPNRSSDQSKVEPQIDVYQMSL